MIFSGGTAGLRLFEIQNSSYTNDLLNATRAYFDSLGLYFKAPENQVRIISGSEEGLSGWISTNMLMDELFKNNKPFETYGVSDMGGILIKICFLIKSFLINRRCKYTNEFCFSKCYE
jgi:Golgi nucleoside diphosphatase